MFLYKLGLGKADFLSAKYQKSYRGKQSFKAVPAGSIGCANAYIFPAMSPASSSSPDIARVVKSNMASRSQWDFRKVRNGEIFASSLQTTITTKTTTTTTTFTPRCHSLCLPRPKTNSSNNNNNNYLASDPEVKGSPPKYWGGGVMEFTLWSLPIPRHPTVYPEDTAYTWIRTTVESKTEACREHDKKNGSS